MVNYTATQVKALKCPAGKKFKSFCIDSSAHLYLICYDTGTKIYKKRVKNGYITIENFKNITLATAREKALNLNQTKQKKFKINDLFFEWLDTQIPNTKENYTIRRKYINRINKWILQKIGDKFINEVDKMTLLSALSGAGFQTAKKNIEIYKKLLKIAKLKGGIDDINFIYEISEDKALIFKKSEVKHRKSVTDKNRLLQIIKIVKNSHINETLKNLFLFNLLTVQRPHQIRELTWDRIKDGFIYFYENNNKTKINARLPLCKKAVEILDYQKSLTGGDGIVFKSSVISKINGDKFSETALLTALKKLKINDFHIHGIRGSFATFAIRESENFDGVLRAKFDKRIIDEILLHTPKNEVDKAYFRDFNSAEHLRILKWWAEFLGFE